jgi:hypothetical protein
MDATFHIKKLDFIIKHLKLYRAKTRVFENSGKINKVWALSYLHFHRLSNISFTFPAIKGCSTTGLTRVVTNLFFMNLLLITIKN